MKIKIVTPQGVIYEKENIESVTLPTADGVITVKEDHVSLISLVIPGEIIIEDEGQEQYNLAVSKGMLEIVKENTTVIRVLADTAERAEDIDIQRAEEARKKAEEYRTSQNDIADVEFALLQAKIEKEMARISVGRKYKGVR